MVKIYIDPGHGGSDNGASGNGIKEKDITLKIAKKINSYLKAYKNVTTKMSRNHDSFPSLNDRTNEANKWDADLFLSVHINSGGGKGFETFVYTSIKNGSKTAKMQKAVHNAILKKNGLKDRGMQKENLHVVRESHMPAILTENGFIDIKKEAKKMKSNKWIRKVAKGHVNGIASHYGLKKKKKGKKRFIEVKVNSLWVYEKKDWDAKKETVSKGDVFTIKKSHKVDGSKMYELKSGLYISGNKKYVKTYKK